MYKRLDDQLRLLKMSNKKPNFAALAREFGCDYRTVKKHYEECGELTEHKRNKPSKLDKHKSLIRSKLQIKGTTIKSVYEFFIDNDLYDGTYSNFRKYVTKNELNKNIEKKVGHPRFETLPGVQAQADWKEDITLTSKHGEIFTFNVFHIELGYSRTSYYEYSIFKQESDVQRCLMNSFKYFGGVPKEILFDNMKTASVRIKGYRKDRVNPKLSVFARQFGFEVRLCKPRASYTKGKVESRNKIIDWIRPYDYEFEDEDELINIIKRINLKANEYICQATNCPPTLLFQKEKEYLSPLPPKSIFESFQSSSSQIVGKDSTIYYKGNKYSVDPALIGEKVGYEISDNKLYIYYNLKLSTVHELSAGHKTINYHEDHYKSLLRPHIKEEELDDFVKMNLNNLDKLVGE